MEWIFLCGTALLVVRFIWGMKADNRRRKTMTEEAWEQRERGASLLGAGAMGLHMVLHADLEKAAAMQEDVRQGMLPSAEQENNRKNWADEASEKGA